jgi:ferredoxin
LFGYLLKEQQMPAKVSKDDCTACGLCVEACPAEAIEVDDVAKVSAEKCTDCGACVDECPCQAITLDA